jgi:uncharacterized protein (DUF111 family)
MSQPFSHWEEHIDKNMMKIEVNLDDIPGEWLGYVMEKLFEAGANDVFYSPIYMKKNRPGVIMHVLCDYQKMNEIKTILFSETTTLGVRAYPISVHRLERNFYDVETKWGMITVKRGLHNGEIVQVAPEYEECRLIAQRYKVPLKEVYHEVWKQIMEINNINGTYLGQK